MRALALLTKLHENALLLKYRRFTTRDCSLWSVNKSHWARRQHCSVVRLSNSTYVKGENIKCIILICALHVRIKVTWKRYSKLQTAFQYGCKTSSTHGTGVFRLRGILKVAWSEQRVTKRSFLADCSHISARLSVIWFGRRLASRITALFWQLRTNVAIGWPWKSNGGTQTMSSRNSRLRCLLVACFTEPSHFSLFSLLFWRSKMVIGYKVQWPWCILLTITSLQECSLHRKEWS